MESRVELLEKDYQERYSLSRAQMVQAYEMYRLAR